MDEMTHQRVRCIVRGIHQKQPRGVRLSTLFKALLAWFM
jgi:hypothetical protein